LAAFVVETADAMAVEFVAAVSEAAVLVESEAAELVETVSWLREADSVAAFATDVLRQAVARKAD
jgi:hypothetical protein